MNIVIRIGTIFIIIGFILLILGIATSGQTRFSGRSMSLIDPSYASDH